MVPPVAITSASVKFVEASVRVKVSDAVSPAMRVVTSLEIEIVGRMVSTVRVYWAGAVLPLPAASVTALAATSMVTLPELDAVGVTTRV
jgi:hypothetical protein